MKSASASANAATNNQDLEDITGDPDVRAPGDTIKYTISYVNNSTQSTTGVYITDDYDQAHLSTRLTSSRPAATSVLLPITTAHCSAGPMKQARLPCQRMPQAQFPMRLTCPTRSPQGLPSSTTPPA